MEQELNIKETYHPEEKQPPLNSVLDCTTNGALMLETNPMTIMPSTNEKPEVKFDR